MVTTEQILEFMQRRVAECQLRGETNTLRQLQQSLALLMEAATAYDDRATASRFQILAARVADAREMLDHEDH